jgi:predicted RNA-binding Zn-ribbon protein involved in translation (DUF1610 family)
VKEVEKNITLGLTRKSLEAIVIHACPKCEAPGVYKNDLRTHALWPGCWNPTMNNKPVGDVCPNCGHRRRGDSNLGELTSSIPRWLWRCILGFKWCVIKLSTLRSGA